MIKNILSVIAVYLLALNASAQVRVSGTVRDASTSEPVAGAVIRVNGTYIYSVADGNGVYSLPLLHTGKNVIVTSCTGYVSKTDTVNTTENNFSLDILLSQSPVLMDEVIVSATRLDERASMAYTNVTKEDLSKSNLGQDLPVMLDQLPSVVTTSDAGAGVGYTGIRIRGSDATRVNVTINGIPVNDAESQGTYWVDLPDIASSINNIQVQRGAGTSANGAGAFGGSMNIETSLLNPKPYGEYTGGAGSFNTLRNTISAGTGLINDRFTVDARLSRITSDGFIDRASSDLKSYYLSAGYYHKKNIIRFITFSGAEETYQAWNGVPESRLHGDVQGMNDFILRNYLDEEDASHLLNSSSRTYNQFTYPGQVDHYMQTYYQLHFAHEFNRNFSMNLAFHYTKGKGYYEEYKKGEYFSSYGLSDVIIGTDTITNTNLVRRRWLDNDFYGATLSFRYKPGKAISLTGGAAWNNYYGLHYGELIWSQYALNSFIHQDYYKDTAQKSDLNIFVRLNYLLFDKLNIFADMQFRRIDYSFLGFDDSLRNIQQDAALNFYNPKAGLNYMLSNSADVYISYSHASKEPSRDDYTQSSPASRPRPEQLDDFEGGFRYHTRRTNISTNLYMMNYKDQLVLTGGINDVGAYRRVNVPKSFRRGIELEAAQRILSTLTWNVNLTLSENKVIDFHEEIVNYDSTGQRVNIYPKSDIAFSPSVIAGSTLMYEPVSGLQIYFISKYVGRQYLDNTSNSHRQLDPFFVNNLKIRYEMKLKHLSSLAFTIAINNIFGEEYESNGYTYNYIYGGSLIVENFYYPQAGTNFLGGISVKF